MPRLARLDIAGLLQHVIVRGIERRDIFKDEHDRQLFVERLLSLLPETGGRCYQITCYVELNITRDWGSTPRHNIAPRTFAEAARNAAQNDAGRRHREKSRCVQFHAQ